MKAKHYFAAGNTGEGFYNCFDFVNDKRRDGFKYVLKGAPGTGKSTLMKKIGRHFEDRGESVEYFHCSSDPQSMDGVRLVSANVSVADGTAPHSSEPSLPGIDGKIVDLGSCIDARVKKHKAEIEKLSEEKAKCFNAAYSHLRSAAEIERANKQMLAEFLDERAVTEAAGFVCGKYVENCSEKKKWKRKLFLSAVSGGGTVDLLGENDYEKTISLNGTGFAAKAVLKEIARELQCNFTAFCSLLNPDEIAGLEIENTLIKANLQDATEQVDLGKILLTGWKRSKDEILYGEQLIAQTLSLAAKKISLAKQLHGEIENYYIKHTNFTQIDRICAELICKLQGE